MPEKKIKHLEMIEAVIERMAKNSFQLKGWAMTLVTAVIALAGKDGDHRFILFAVIPAIGFWVLDSYYLQQERRYKQLYKNVAAKAEDDIDFNLDAGQAVGTTEETDNLCLCSCLFSVTEVCFYLLMVAAVIAAKYFLG